MLTMSDLRIREKRRLVRLTVAPIGERLGAPATADSGRIEYLLDRTLDQETRRSLAAILKQAE